jgi:hypothetical protein
VRPTAERYVVRQMQTAGTVYRSFEAQLQGVVQGPLVVSRGHVCRESWNAHGGQCANDRGTSDLAATSHGTTAYLGPR